MMNFNEYQEQAAKFAIYPQDIDGFSYCILGLCSEAGEIASKYKKVLRGDRYILDRQDTAQELGDLLWYIAQLASELRISLNDIAETNLAKLQDRQQRGTLQGEGDNR